MTTAVQSSTVGWEVRPDCLFVLVIRTYAPGQYAEVMKFLKAKAKEVNRNQLAGEVKGEARRRLFQARGWKVVASSDIDQLYLMEYVV